MRRFFVPADFIGLVKLRKFFLEGADAPGQLEDILLLPENFLIQRGDRIVLQGREGFEFYDAFFHARKLTG